MADTKICFSFLLFDNSCHAYRSDDFGATWIFQQTTPLDATNGFFDYALATADGDYNTQVSFVFEIGGDINHFALTFSQTGNSNDWITIDPSIAPVDTNKMRFITGAVSAGGSIILAPPITAATTVGSYPRISYDSGATWASITTVPADREWGPCCFTANTTKMYMTWVESGGGSSGVSVSLDNGTTWADLPGAPSGYFVFGSSFESGQRLRCTPDGHGLIYNDSSGNALFSLNGGATWTIVNDVINVTTLFPVFVYDSANADCAISDNGRTMLFSFGNVSTDTYPYRSIFFISKDAGVTWTELVSPSITDPGVGLGAYILFNCNISPDGRALVATFQDNSFDYRVDMSLDLGATWKSEDFTPFLTQIGSTWVTAFVFPNNQPPAQTSLFVASASDASGPTTNIMSSEDGSTWALQTTPSGSGSVAYNGICYSQSLGIFCAVGNTDGSHQTAVMTSPDGVVWTFQNLPTLLSLNSVGWTEAIGIFIAVGSGSDGSQFGYVFTSPDGVTWTKQTCPVGKWVNIAPPPQIDSGANFIACSSAYNGTSFPYSVMYSTDGVTWTGAAGHASSTADGGWAAVVYAGWAASSANRFIAVGGDSTSAATTGAIMYSGLNDPANWTLITHPAHTACLGVAYESKDDRAVAVGPYDASTPTHSGAFYSDDHGQTWSTYTPIEGKWDSLIWAFDTEMFVSVGAANGSSTNIVMTSPDGIAWSAQVTDATINAKSFGGVAYRQASPTEDACILIPFTPKGGYIIERFDNRIWPTAENAWCVDCAFTLARPAPNADLHISSATGAGILTGIINLDGGENYSGATTVQVVDGNGLGPGTGANAIPTIVSGVIVAITFSPGGTGYIYPKLVFNDPENTGSGASADITIDNSATFSTSAPVFVSGDIGSVIRAGYGVATITAYTDPQTVTANILSPIVAVQPDDPAPNAVQTQVNGTWTMTKPISTFRIPQLAGFEITGLADGQIIPPVVVPDNGVVTLGTPASAIIVGLAFQAQLQSTYLDAGEPTVQGQRKKIAEVTVRVEQSAAFQIGGNQPDGSVQSPPQLAPLWQNMVDAPTHAVAPFGSTTLPLFTGDIRIPTPSGYNTKGQIAVQQLKPLPLQVLDYVPEVLSGDKPAQEAPQRQRGKGKEQ